MSGGFFIFFRFGIYELLIPPLHLFYNLSVIVPKYSRNRQGALMCTGNWSIFLDAIVKPNNFAGEYVPTLNDAQIKTISYLQAPNIYHKL